MKVISDIISLIYKILFQMNGTFTDSSKIHEMCQLIYYDFKMK